MLPLLMSACAPGSEVEKPERSDPPFDTCVPTPVPDDGEPEQLDVASDCYSVGINAKILGEPGAERIVMSAISCVSRMDAEGNILFVDARSGEETARVSGSDPRDSLGYRMDALAPSQAPGSSVAAAAWTWTHEDVYYGGTRLFSGDGSELGDISSPDYALGQELRFVGDHLLLGTHYDPTGVQRLFVFDAPFRPGMSPADAASETVQTPTEMVVGWDVFDAGDVDGDGVSDAVIGSDAIGETRLVSGIDLTVADFFDTGTPLPVYLLTRDSFTRIGDLDGDGLSDFAVGTFDQSLSMAGEVDLFTGGSPRPVARLYDRSSTIDSLGDSFALVGDLDGDGFESFVIPVRLDGEYTSSESETRFWLVQGPFCGVDAFEDAATALDLSDDHQYEISVRGAPGALFVVDAYSDGTDGGPHLLFW